MEEKPKSLWENVNEDEYQVITNHIIIDNHNIFITFKVKIIIIFGH